MFTNVPLYESAFCVLFPQWCIWTLPECKCSHGLLHTPSNRQTQPTCTQTWGLFWCAVVLLGLLLLMMVVVWLEGAGSGFIRP